ncbi:MAG TPA: FAD-dependent oxidoreductase, partial [Polyangiaceae bacterium]|nr:FAD-dependent oxidoreductase [Polyangiaceae bacterium]
LRHVLVPGFTPARPPDPASFDAVISTLPPDRLLAVSDRETRQHPIFRRLAQLTNVHPLSVRLWFERPVNTSGTDYVLSSGTVFDVLRPTPERQRYAGIHLIDLLVDNIESHLPELPYDGERYLSPGHVESRVLARVLADLERVYPGEIRKNRVLRRFLHTREGIIAARPGVWSKRPPQYLGSEHFFLAGDFTRQAHGVCMEGAVRSGQLAARSLLAGRQASETPGAFQELARALRNVVDELPAALSGPLRGLASRPRAGSRRPGSDLDGRS